MLHKRVNGIIVPWFNSVINASNAVQKQPGFIFVFALQPHQRLEMKYWIIFCIVEIIHSFSTINGNKTPRINIMSYKE